MEQLDEKTFQCLLGIFYELTWQILFIVLGACGKIGRAKSRNELISVLGVVVPAAKAVMRYL